MRVDSTHMAYIQWNGSGNNYGMSFGAGATTSHPGNVNEVMRIFSGANVSIGSTSSAYGRLFVDAATNPAACALAVRGRDSSASYIALNVMNNADGELFSILNNGRAKFTGSVGIGTGSPSTKLDVYHATDSQITVSSNSDSSGNSSLALIERSANSAFGSANTYGFQWTYDGGDNKLYLTSGNQTSIVNRLTSMIVTGKRY